MRIGIDVREVLDRPTGIGRYLSAILAEWARWPETEAHHLILFAPVAVEGLPVGLRSLLGAGTDGRLRLRHVPGGRGTWWEQIQLPSALRREPVDVWFAPAYSAPLAARAPVVLAIYDVSFLVRPEWFRPREGLRRRWVVRRSAARAQQILTSSEFSRAEIIVRLRVPANRVEVIPLGVKRPDRRAPPSARPPLVLFVGSIFNRRRVPDLLEAFKRVLRHAPEASLVIVGENRTYPYQDLEKLARHWGVAHRTTFHPYLEPEALEEVYGRARVFAFLSEYEGFGLTPLEALAAGAPAVVLDTPVAREIYGDAARYVRRGDIEGTAEAILALLHDEATARTLVARAESLLDCFTWERSARATWTALLRAGRAAR